jgi:nitrogen fixation protein NifB
MRLEEDRPDRSQENVTPPIAVIFVLSLDSAPLKRGAGLLRPGVVDMPKFNCQNKQFGHPCFDIDSHCTAGRIHLPVAPRCNIKCQFCSRKHDCANENRPGVTSRIITPDEALEWVERAIKNDPRIVVAGIAGPGDPLANEGTFETLRLIDRRFPGLNKCLSTNGLLLPDRLDSLLDAGLDTLTVTVNALHPDVGAQIYAWAELGGRKYYHQEAARLLFYNQISGLEKAVKRGLRVKVNSVLIPGLNDLEMPELAALFKNIGVGLMNIMPLLPQAEMAHWPPVSNETLNNVRTACEKLIPQSRHCKQCRADAVGIPGLEKKEVPCLSGKNK